MMEKLLFLHIFLFCWRSLNALFTVEAPKSLYTAELGSNVTMECIFPVNGKLKFRDLSVIWEKKDDVRKDVYVLLKGKEDSGSQHSDFQGRIKLLKENLDLGQSLLQISNVKLRDAGLYHCLIEYGGADYKTINLKVQAPYRSITQEVISTGDKEWKLTCQSKGFPKAEVMWQNGECQDLTNKANTSYETGSDQLYRVTSTLTIKNRTRENFRCIFWNKETQENTSANLYILDSTDDVLWTESRLRAFVWPILIVSVLVGSVSITVCIRKAKANKDCRTRMAKPSINITKLLKDKDVHDCRDPSFEDQELKYMQIEKT
ncbi:programmed cell death 1 ligand 1 isoform X1 [Coturnix japonica]|uniref:Programmed cell death 1 ligand 1-like n=2 Tax=Coturnix japonica TaxID=93934 RepID=A0A8C2SS48_COTJA|nr:programmed cell death 1 ligand 1 isoform X1 [Coturnix japonica]XP_032297226.1 programmed cell death 1 ligand 1 isoform X1 [Coturnix japonica]